MNQYILKHVNILDGTYQMKVKEDYDLFIVDDKIQEIGKDLNKDVKTYDMHHAYLLPGLINMHVHLPGSGKVGGKKVADLGKLISFIKSNKLTQEIGIKITASGAKTALYAGTTTVRAVGGVGDLDSRVAKRIEKGKLVGARVISANEAICTPGGHMAGTVSKEVETIEEAVKLVEDTKKSGADFIKLMITGGVLDCKVKGHPGELKMSEDMVQACCDKAHEIGLKVAAHVEGPEGIEIASRCGVDTIEHGAIASREALNHMLENKSSLICTLSPAVPLSLFTPDITGYDDNCQYNSSVLFEGMKKVVKDCLDHHIPVGLGTDTGCPFVTHYDMWRELYYFTQYIDGVDNNFAIHTATCINSQILGLDKEIGTVEVGKKADLLIVKDNPLDDLSSLREPMLVIKDGKQYTNKNKKYENIEVLLDKLM